MSTLSVQAPAESRPSLVVSLIKSVWPLLVVVALSVAAQVWLKPWLGPYNAILMLNVGISIILAVSLNIVNGFTGQFSMGHAGFLAVGGYASGMLTYYVSMRVWGTATPMAGVLSGMPLDPSGLPLFTWGEVVFLGSVIVGG